MRYCVYAALNALITLISMGFPSVFLLFGSFVSLFFSAIFLGNGNRYSVTGKATPGHKNCQPLKSLKATNPAQPQPQPKVLYTLCALPAIYRAGYIMCVCVCVCAKPQHCLFSQPGQPVDGACLPSDVPNIQHAEREHPFSSRARAGAGAGAKMPFQCEPLLPAPVSVSLSLARTHTHSTRAALSKINELVILLMNL